MAIAKRRRPARRLGGAVGKAFGSWSDRVAAMEYSGEMVLWMEA